MSHKWNSSRSERSRIGTEKSGGGVRQVEEASDRQGRVKDEGQQEEEEEQRRGREEKSCGRESRIP